MSEKWIKVSCLFSQHPKTTCFAKRLEISRREAVGYLIDWFVWVRRYAETGYIENVDTETMEEAVGWNGKKTGKFRETLDALGWVVDGWVQKWPEYGGAEVVEKAKRKPEEYREMIDYYGINPYGKIPEKKPPRREEKRRDKKTLVVGEEAEKCYHAYPSKTLRKGSDVSTGKSLKHKEKIQKILDSGYPLLLAINHYAKETDHHKNLSTFLNNLPDPDTIPKPKPKLPPLPEGQCCRNPSVRQLPWGKRCDNCYKEWRDE